MIEVEKKIALNSEEDVARLTRGAEFVKEVVQTDIYYDTADFTLTTRDRWLRTRNGAFDLKLPLHREKSTERFTDQFDELEDEASIRTVLHLPIKHDLAHDLTAAGYTPFATIVTTRRKFKHGPFSLDIDYVDYGDSTYLIGEIELMVRDEAHMQDAVQQIQTFLDKQQIEIKPVRGKVTYYIQEYRPAHFQALVDAGVIVQ